MNSLNLYNNPNSNTGSSELRINYFVLLLLIVFQISSLFAQETEIRFKHISNQDGLSNDIVNCIAQDHKGFMWIGTMEGLNRYDGSKMTVFKRDLDDTLNIADNMIYDIYVDHKGDIWIGTQNGLCLYDTDHEKFRTYLLNKKMINLNTSNRVTCINETADNELIAAVELGFLYKFNKEKNNFEKIDYNFHSIKDFTVDNEGIFWIGGVEGFYSYNMYIDEYKKYDSFIENHNKILIKEVNTISQEGDTIWIGTIKGKIYYLLKSTEEIFSLKHDFDKTYFIYEIFKSTDGKIYVASTDGLYIYDKKKDNYISYKYNKEIPFGLSRVGITTVFEDFQNNIWLGSYQGGINLITANKEFNNYNFFSKVITLDIININTIIEDSKGILWLGSFDIGINVIDPKSNKRKTYFHNPEDPFSLGYGSVYSIFEDSKHNIWTGTYLGFLQKLPPGSNKFISYPFSPDVGNMNKGLDIRSITEDEDGYIWIIPHGNGLAKFNPKTGKFKHYFQDLNNLEGTIADNWAFQIIIDHLGYIWIATPSGLSKFNKKTESFQNFYPNDQDKNSICDNFINVIYEDSNNNLWIGTKFGLSLFKRDNNYFHNFYERDGLPSNQIKGILEHKPGELWISTGYGLSRMRYFEADKKDSIAVNFKNYNKSDNLQDNFFLDRSACKTKDGKLIFGCEKGIVLFDPDKITENTLPPKVYITSFKLFSKEVHPVDENSILTNNIMNTSEIKLKHNQNFFTFNYIAINYISNENNQYKYKLEGFDEDWIDAGNKHEASYTNVNPGKYIFKVIASNNDGYWNNEGTSINVIISPPLTGTWWFRIIIILLIITLIVAFNIIRTKTLKKQNIILEKKVKERTSELTGLNSKIQHQNDLLERQKNNIEKAYKELTKYRNKLEELVEERTKELIIAKDRALEADRLKSSFLANLSHEIRTPLNSIIGFSNLLFESEVSEDDKETFKNIIEGNNNILLSLINDIIDFSKIESGHLDIVFKEVLLKNIFNELQKIYELEIKKHIQDVKKNIEFKLNIADEAKEIVIITDEIRLKQLFTNLINNAIKFTHEGFIEVGCNVKSDNMLEFYVKDTGIGIEEKYHEAIFDRFIKLEEESYLYRGAGIGLTITKELVKLLGGSIHLDSIPGKGTKFSFTLPIKINGNKMQVKENNNKSKGIPELSGKTVLIAEDDISNFTYLEKLMQRTNAKILHALNGKEVLNFYKDDNSIALILMDIKMPEMDGISALKELKKLKFNAPAIAQTAYAFSDEIRKIMSAGFNEYITKPIIPKDLYELIDKYFK
ncbi:two-component regulator propeller domain-containing protein [Bacteroidota bacterium]